MKALLFALISLVMSQAMASSEQDRVCVGSIQDQNQEDISFVLQWSIERTYDQGRPSEDNHKVSVEARSCVGSFSDLCSVAKAAPYILTPQAKPLVPVQLVDSRKNVLFKGQLDISKEELTGEFKGAVTGAVQLQCVTQPFMKLN